MEELEEELLELDELLEEDSLETLGSELGWLSEELEDDDAGGVPQEVRSSSPSIKSLLRMNLLYSEPQFGKEIQ